MASIPADLLKQLPKPDRHGLRLVLCPTWVILPDGSRCLLEVKPLGQQDPDKGDLLVVVAKLGIGVDEERHLPASLRFQDKLKLLGQELTVFWGTLDAKKELREVSLEDTATVWVDALSKAETRLLSDVAALWVRLTKRQESLTSKGEDYYTLYKSGLAGER